MIKENAKSLHGFAWYIHRLPAAESPGPGACPFSGVDSSYRPLHWPVVPGEAGVQNLGPGPAFLVVAPTLTWGPPQVGWDWLVEPAELDGYQTRDGRVRLVGVERHRTRWGTVSECEFASDSGPAERPWGRPELRLPCAGCAVDQRDADTQNRPLHRRSANDEYAVA